MYDYFYVINYLMKNIHSSTRDEILFDDKNSSFRTFTRVYSLVEQRFNLPKKAIIRWMFEATKRAETLLFLLL
jgi:hypothetical protein